MLATVFFLIIMHKKWHRFSLFHFSSYNVFKFGQSMATLAIYKLNQDLDRILTNLSQFATGT